MKDIKSYVIGFLTCACMFLIMGQTSNLEKMNWNVEDIELEMNVSDGTINIGNEYGRYQAISGNEYEHFYLLDTETGAVYNHIENPENTYKKRLADVWNRSPRVIAFSKP